MMLLLFLEGRQTCGCERDGVSVSYSSHPGKEQMWKVYRFQVQLTCTSWIQSSCTMLRTVTILSIGIETIISFLTTQVDGRLSLLHLPEDAGEEVIQDPSLQAKVYKNIHWSQMLLCH